MQIVSAVSGTLLNAATVTVGGVCGALLGDRLPNRLHESLFGVLGLFTVLIGLEDVVNKGNPLILLGALLLGTIIGETANLEGKLTFFGDRLQGMFAKEGSTLSEAFVTSSLVFCVGPLSIIGSLDNGLKGDITKLALKSTLDGFSALAFGAALGWGVLLSVATILIYQGAISLGAHALAPVLNANPQTIVELTAAGGLILIAIGLKLLKIRDLRVVNMLPALIVSPALVLLVAAWPHFVH